MQTDMHRVRTVHFVGIGGCGMSAIAKILIKMGYQVSGSDLKESINTIRLRDMGARVFIGHDRSNIRGVDLAVVSSAIPVGNPEIDAASQSGIPIERRASMLSWIMDQFKVRVAVAGTHGKTTTTSMIAVTMGKCGRDPTFLIGGEANDVDGNARLGKSDMVVAEADESDGTYLLLHPTVAVVTNIEADHMEHFQTFEKVIDAFVSFSQLVPADGIVVVGGDGPGILEAKKRLKDKKMITYGLSPEFDYHAEDFSFNERSSRFRAFAGQTKLGEVSLSVPGQQNIENALAAISVGLHLGCDFGHIASGLQTFTGAKRRFQVIGEEKDIMIVDDYGHHPTEVARTLEAAKLGYPGRRVICVFQPHRFTRTLHLFEDFGKAFDKADEIIITDIYSAGERPIAGISGETIHAEINKHGKKSLYIKKKEQITSHLMETLRPGDMVITMGAGDINTVGKEVLLRLKERE